MKYDFQLLFLLIGIGLISKRLTWKGWFGVALMIFVWMMFNWVKA